MTKVYLAAPTLYCWNSIHPYELLNYCEAHIDNETGDFVLETLYSTQEEPPVPKEGFAICRDINAKKWIYLPDYRGQFYWTKDMTWKDTGIPILYPGELEEGATLTRPPKPNNVIRTELKLAIREKKQVLRVSGVVVDDIRYDTDYNAGLAYLDFINKTKHDPDRVERWRASADNWVDMNRELCLRVYAEVDKYITNVYKWQEQKEMELANTKDADLVKFKI